MRLQTRQSLKKGVSNTKFYVQSATNSSPKKSFAEYQEAASFALELAKDNGVVVIIDSACNIVATVVTKDRLPDKERSVFKNKTTIEKIKEAIDRPKPSFSETCITYCDKSQAFISSDERRWINHIRKLKNEYPDLVEIDQAPELNDGCICAKFPTDWVKVLPKRKVSMSDEQRAAVGARLKAGRSQL